MGVKIWVDDVRPMPEGYDVHCKCVDDASAVIGYYLGAIEVLDLDHDAGDYAEYGGDFIEILNFMEERGWDAPIRLHTMNPVGRENMTRIIKRNGWKLLP